MKIIRKENTIVSLENVARVSIIEENYKRTRKGNQVWVRDYKIKIEYTDSNIHNQFLETELEDDEALKVMEYYLEKIEEILNRG